MGQGKMPRLLLLRIVVEMRSRQSWNPSSLQETDGFGPYRAEKGMREEWWGDQRVGCKVGKMFPSGPMMTRGPS